MDEPIIDLREKYKPNSMKSKAEEKTEPSKKEVHQITKTQARIRKKSPGKKFLESFIADDAVNIKDYIIYDVLLPALKNTVVDAVTNSIQMIFWGDKRPSSNTLRSGGKTYVSYGSYSSISSSNNRRDMGAGSRARHNFDDLVLSSRGEAEDVLSQLVDLTIDYGFASIADLYYMTGLQSTPTDQKWGWRDLSTAYVARVRDGYMIKLPKTILIN